MASFADGGVDGTVDEKRPLLSERIEKSKQNHHEAEEQNSADDDEEAIELTGCGATAACNPHRALHRFLVLILICFLSFG